MSSLFQRLTGLSFRSEMLLINLLGLVDSTLDWSSHKWTSQVERVWNLSLTRASFAYNTIDEDQVKTILTWIVVTRVIVANLYTCAYLANIFSVLTWTRSFLLLPWLMVSVFKNFFIEILIILIGLLLSYEEELPTALIVEFILVKVIDFALAGYTFCANTRLYLYLKYRKKLREMQQSENSDSCAIGGASEGLMESIKQTKYRSRSLSALTSSSLSSNTNGSDSLSRILNDPVATPAQKAMIVLGLSEVDIVNATKKSSRSRLLDSLVLDTDHEMTQYYNCASPLLTKEETKSVDSPKLHRSLPKEQETILLGPSCFKAPIQTQFEEKDSKKTVETTLDSIEIIEEEMKGTAPSTCDGSPSNDMEKVCLEDQLYRKLTISKEKLGGRSTTPSPEYSKLETKREQPCAAIMRNKEIKFCPFTKMGSNLEKSVDNRSDQLAAKDISENLKPLTGPSKLNPRPIINEEKNNTICKTLERLAIESTNVNDRNLTDAMALKRKFEEEEAIIRSQQKIAKVDFLTETVLQRNIEKTVADTNGNTICDRCFSPPIVVADKKLLPCSGPNPNIATNNSSKLAKDMKNEADPQHSKPVAKESSKKTGGSRIERNETCRDKTSDSVKMANRTTQTPTKLQRKKHFCNPAFHQNLTEQASKVKSPNIKPRRRYFYNKHCGKYNEDGKVSSTTRECGNKEMDLVDIENSVPLVFLKAPTFSRFDNITIRKTSDRSLTRRTVKIECQEKKVDGNVNEAKLIEKKSKRKSKTSPNQNIQATSSQEMRALRAYNELTLLEDKKALEQTRLSRNSESKSELFTGKSTTKHNVTPKKKNRELPDKASGSGQSDIEWNKENSRYMPRDFEYTDSIRGILLQEFPVKKISFETLDNALREEEHSCDKLKIFTEIAVAEHETNRRVQMESEKIDEVSLKKIEIAKTDESRENNPEKEVLESTNTFTTQPGILVEPKPKNSEIASVNLLRTAPFQAVELGIDHENHRDDVFANPNLEKIFNKKLTFPFDDQKTESLRSEVNWESTDFRTASFIDPQDIVPHVQNLSVADLKVSPHIPISKAAEDNSGESAFSENECNANENTLEKNNTDVQKSDNTSRLQEDGKLVVNAMFEMNEIEDISVEGADKKILDEKSDKKSSPTSSILSKDVFPEVVMSVPLENAIRTEVFTNPLLESEAGKIKTECEGRITENEKSVDDMLLHKNSPKPEPANLTVFMNILTSAPPEKCNDLSQDTRSDVISQNKSKSSCETTEDPIVIASTSRNIDSKDVADENIQEVEHELLESDIVNTFDDVSRLLDIDYEAEEGTQFTRTVFLWYSTAFTFIGIFVLVIYDFLRMSWRRLCNFRCTPDVANSEATVPGIFEDEAESNIPRNIIEPLDEEDTADETLELIRKAENIDEGIVQFLRADVEEEEILKPVQGEDNTKKEVSPVTKKTSVDPKTSSFLGNLLSAPEERGIFEKEIPAKDTMPNAESCKIKDDTIKEKLSPISQPEMFLRYRNPNDEVDQDTTMQSFIENTVATFFRAGSHEAAAPDAESVKNEEKDVSVAASSELDVRDREKLNNLVQQFSGMSVRPLEVTDSFGSIYSAQSKKSTDVVSLENASDFEEFSADRATCPSQSTNTANSTE